MIKTRSENRLKTPLKSLRHFPQGCLLTPRFLVKWNMIAEPFGVKLSQITSQFQRVIVTEGLQNILHWRKSSSKLVS